MSCKTVTVVVKRFFILYLHFKFGNEVCLKLFHLELMTSTFNGLCHCRIIYLRQYGQNKNQEVFILI